MIILFYCRLITNSKSQRCESTLLKCDGKFLSDGCLAAADRTSTPTPLSPLRLHITNDAKDADTTVAGRASVFPYDVVHAVSTLERVT